MWIKEVIASLDRKRAEILFGEHAAKDKNLNTEDIDNVLKTIRVGKIDEYKSTEEKRRVCFKNYFDVSEIIPPNEIRGLETPSATGSGMISEHVKNHPTKGGRFQNMPPSVEGDF